MNKEEYFNHPVFKYFRQINQIPRCSYNEDMIADYLYKKGIELGYESLIDRAGNVMIKKPATISNMASDVGRPLKVIIQAHMDMVCVKTEDSNHDFSKDPIDMYEEDGWLKAKSTSLGADDGIGIAIALALLEEKGDMPELDILITRSEEVGMDGAIALEESWLDADMLLNIDSEEEGQVTCSCAGGSGAKFFLPLQRVEKDKDRQYKISLSGLKGGHSGINILAEPNNAIKILSELLGNIYKEEPFFLYDFRGGTKHNAIPDSAEAVIGTVDDDSDFSVLFRKVADEIQARLLKQEPDIKIEISQSQLDKKALSTKSQEALFNLINILPHGVYQMREDGSGVLASDNLAIVSTDKDKAEIHLSLRSSSYEALKKLQNEILKAVNTFEAEGVFEDSYPAWEYSEDSRLREVFMEVYKEETGKDAEILSIHAGLECGIFAKKNPKLDMISIGPDVKGAHTVQEALNIESTIRTYEYVKKVLAALAS